MYFLHVLAVLLLISAPAMAQEANSCTPVAKFMGHSICKEEIALEEEHVTAIKQQYEDQGLDSEAALKGRSLERLKDLVWEKALLMKFGPERLSPSEDDIAHYSKTLKDMLEKSHNENLKLLEKIKGLMEEDGHSQDELRQLSALRETLETSIGFYNERQKYNDDMPPEFHAMVAEAERGIAETNLQDWLKNKALYQEYGGLVVLDQGRPVPIEAYEKFIGYIRSEAQLVILDKEYKDLFKNMQAFINAMKKNTDAIPEADSDGTYSSYFESPFQQF